MSGPSIPACSPQECEDGIYFVTPKRQDSPVGVEDSSDYVDRGAMSYHIAIVLFMLVVVVAFLLNSGFSLLLFRGRKTSFKFPFYILVWQMIVLNIIAAVSQLCLMPGFLNKDNKLPQEVSTILQFLDVWCTYSIILFMLLIAANRFAVFAASKSLSWMVERTGICILSAIMLAAATLIAVLLTVFNCVRKYNEQARSYEDSCSTHEEVTVIWMYWTIIYTFYALPVIMCALYIGIYIKLKIQREKININTSTKKEIRVEKQLLKQSLIYSIVYYCLNGVSFLLMLVVVNSPNASFYLALLFKGVDQLIGCLFPIFFIITSKETRKVIFSIAHQTTSSLIVGSGSTSQQLQVQQRQRRSKSTSH